MKILFATSEALPFAMSGGLADVAGALPKALRRRLVGCRVVMPLYGSISEELRANMKFITSITVPVSWRRQYCGIFEAKVDGVIYYLLDNQYYFKREGLYGHYDDAERFTFFSRAVLEILLIDEDGNNGCLSSDRDHTRTALYLCLSGIFFRMTGSLREHTAVLSVRQKLHHMLYGANVRLGAIDGKGSENLYKIADNGNSEKLLLCHIADLMSFERIADLYGIGCRKMIGADEKSVLFGNVFVI